MKKVLIVNATAIGEKKGTGVTLQNIWSCYPKDSILQVIVDWQNAEKDENVHTIYTPIEFCRLPYSLHKQFSKKRKATISVSNGSVKQKGFKACLHDCLRGFLDAFPINCNCIMKNIKDFSPDVIYTCGGSIRVLKTVNYIAEKLEIPVILHLMDDWSETIYTTSVLTKPFHVYVEYLLRETHNHCKCNFAISKALGNKYSLKYGKEYLALMNPAIRISNVTYGICNEVVEFIYAGSLNLNRWKSLLEIAAILKEEKSREHYSNFTLYVPAADIQLYADKFAEYGVLLKPYIAPEMLRKVYKESDVLIFAESFDTDVINFAKYSLSTKIPEYMSTGKPILAYLSNELYSSQYIREKQVAILASNKEELSQAISDIFLKPNWCEKTMINALKEVKEEHSVESCSKKIFYAIEKACENEKI